MRAPLQIAVLLIGCVLLASAPANASITVVDLQPRAMAILEASCAECHDGTGRRRDKGDFDHVLDVKKMIEGEYFLVPGDPAFSEIYAVMIEEDPDLRMPPPDNTKVHQPTEEEIQLIRDWILAMSEDTAAVVVTAESSVDDDAVPTNEPSDAVPASVPSDPLPPESMEAEKTEAANAPPTLAVEIPVEAVETTAEFEPRTLLGRMHPLFVHFPVAMLPMAGFIGFFGLLLKRYDSWLPALRWSLWFTALIAPLSVASGWIQADLEGYSDATVFIHRWSAVVLTVFSWIALGLLEVSERKGTLRWRWIAVGFLLLAVLLASIVGHTGGELVYGEGYLFGD